MNCDVCGQQLATIFLTQIVDGKMQKVNLCERCSHEKGVTDPDSFALTDLLKGIGAAQDLSQGASVLKCASCGLTQVDFKKTGRFGCANCYETFGDNLDAILKPMHSGLAHCGKVPTRLRRIMEREERLRLLRDELTTAVEAENYEMAAGIRDSIRAMESGQT
jgi:protein arginine kinase activator